MKLLLDEHYSPVIAERLVEAGHGATTVRARGPLGVSDDHVLVAATADDRAVLTNNARDFVPLARRWAAEGRSHAGIVLTADGAMPRGKDSIGVYVTKLTELFEEHPAPLALRDQVRWLA